MPTTSNDRSIPRSAVIVDALRTPIGRRKGGLSGWHPTDLLAETLQQLVTRAGVDPGDVDDVIAGCVSQVGAQSTNIARNAVLGAGWPHTVPGTTVDRQCGSSLQAVHFAAQGVVAGAYDTVVAAGVESMSVVPMFSNAEGNLGDPYGEGTNERFADVDTYGTRGVVPQGLSAELVAERYGLTREVLDEFALRSHERAGRARRDGIFDAEIALVPAKKRDEVAVGEQGVLGNDEGIRETSLEALGDLRPVFRPDGRITAGNSSQISDGSAAVLIMEEHAAREQGLAPLARIVDYAVVGSDPIEMLTGPIPATKAVLGRAGLSVGDIGRFEINEAFAPVVLAWQQALGVDPERVNVNGGAIALGHPLGATGVRLLVSLVHELQRSGERYGLIAICEGGGMANALVIERLDDAAA